MRFLRFYLEIMISTFDIVSETMGFAESTLREIEGLNPYDKEVETAPRNASYGCYHVSALPPWTHQFSRA